MGSFTSGVRVFLNSFVFRAMVLQVLNSGLGHHNRLNIGFVGISCLGVCGVLDLTQDSSPDRADLLLHTLPFSSSSVRDWVSSLGSVGGAG